MFSRYPEVNKELELVEEYIKSSVRSRNRLLSDILSDLVEAGGKRLRPAFVILSSRFGRYNGKKVIPAAAAVEILHTATLIHDDIIDCAKIRRGKPAVSDKYGTDMAVYAGDFMYTKAVLMLSGVVKSDKLDIMAKAIKTICEGEVDQYRERYNINISTLSYLKRIGRKTAVLFSSACALGAGIAHCPAHVRRTLARFGYYFGVAFQIRDDLNDILLDTNATGKPVGKDIAEGVITLPVILAIKRSDRIRSSLLEYFGNNTGFTMEEFRSFINEIKETGAIDVTISILNDYIGRGLEELGKLPDNSSKKVLRDMIVELGICSRVNYLI